MHIVCSTVSVRLCSQFQYGKTNRVRLSSHAFQEWISGRSGWKTKKDENWILRWENLTTVQLLSRTFGKLRRWNMACVPSLKSITECSAVSHQFISSHHRHCWNKTKLHTRIDSQWLLHVIFVRCCLPIHKHVKCEKVIISLMHRAHTVLAHSHDVPIRNSHWTILQKCGQSSSRNT